MALSGLTQVEAALDRWMQETHQKVNKAIGDAVESTYSGSQDRCPVDTGQMKGSGGKEQKDLHGEVFYTAPYSLFVEVGHHTRSGSFVAPQPFLVPPFLKAGQDFHQECEQIVKR